MLLVPAPAHSLLCHRVSWGRHKPFIPETVSRKKACKGKGWCWRRLSGPSDAQKGKFHRETLVE